LSLWHGANAGWWPILWFTGKVVIGIFIFVWLRGTLPRLRYDQFMQFGWKILIPINLVWILDVIAEQTLRNQGWELWRAVAVPAAVTLLVVIVPGLMIWEGSRARRTAERAEDEEDAAQQPLTFPVPPLDLEVPTPPRMLTKVRAGAPPSELEPGQGDSDD
jgi:NADH-quinone oxidoreductase subunit H